jgi:formate dehydrogenase accessory protein FdhE
VLSTITPADEASQYNKQWRSGKVALGWAWADNRAMANSSWQRRIQRAEELAGRYPFAAEILGFYIHVARFQETLYQRLEAVAAGGVPQGRPSGLPELPVLTANFGPFLEVAEKNGPPPLAATARGLKEQGAEIWSELLDRCWSENQAPQQGHHELLARAFLQPYAEFVRSHIAMRWDGYLYALCPFCNRQPGLGVLRQLGDGARRSLICSFCLAEWNFRRLVCPGCGEENDRKLPVYTAAEFDSIRVECCDTCKRYIKTVDLTRDGLAEPLVDEIASAPLDLWAREHAYAKLEVNVMGM